MILIALSVFLLVVALVGGYVVFTSASEKNTLTLDSLAGESNRGYTDTPPSMDNLEPGDVSVFLRDQLNPWFVWATTSDNGPCTAMGFSKVQWVVRYSDTWTWSGTVDSDGDACGFGIATKADSRF